MSTVPSREEALFADALALPEGRRVAFLDTACADDPILRARIIALLAAHEGAGMLEPAGGPHFSILPDEGLGDLIGRYKLLVKIGEGGCGVVFLAEQTDPVRRRVALKVIKAGMDTREVIARFEAERQALALMDHPGICKVLDAGATAAGRPYFVMELVRGVPITKYCDENHLTTCARLNLFIQVCQAVQHAHQKGIIHRDLKPSNILVTLHGSDPAPKVIDFGIAKATQGRLTDATLVTAFEQFMGTPAYMSPEQAEMSALDIDTRSDVYSLGVLLYELLIGRPPFDSKTLMVASRDELRRIIREVEPPKPSAQLSTLASADETMVASRRGTEPAKLRTLLRGDLDWIVMKALEKNRVRRYETPAALGDDIARHLRHEPIVAGRPGNLYRMVKFTRRHRFVVSAVSAFTFVLMSGVIVITRQAVRATRAEKQARIERDAAKEANRAEAQARADARRREEQAERLLFFMLGDLRVQLNGVGRLDLIESVVDKAMEYVASLNSRDLNDTALAGKAKALSLIGTVRLSQSRLPEALSALTESYGLASVLCGRQRSNGELLFERAQAEYYISVVHRRRRDLTAAGEWIARYRDSGAELVKLDPANLRWQQEFVSAQHNVAVLELDRGNLEAGRNGLLAKLAMSEKMAADNPTDPELQLSLANTISFLGTVAERRGEFPEALERYRAQTSRLESLLETAPKDMVRRYSSALSTSLLVDVLAVTGRRSEARELLTRALGLFDTVVAHDPANQRWLSNSLSARLKEVLLDRADGKLPEALGRLEEIRPKIETLVVKEPSDRNLAGLLVTAWRLEAELRLATGRADASEAASHAVERAAFLITADLADRKILGECAQAHIIAGIIADSEGQRDPGLRHWKRVLEMLEAHLVGSNDWRLLDPAARALAFLGRLDESRQKIRHLHALGYRPLQPWPEAVAANLSVSPTQKNN